MKPASGGPSVLMAVIAALSGTLGGCTSIAPLPPVDPHAPGWQVREVSAVWRPRRGAPELIGELLFAANPTSAARLVQFSKQGLPLVTAQVATNGWEISSPLSPGGHRGRLPAPGRVLWFQLDALPPGSKPASPWRLLSESPVGGWTLVNDRTGESLEVVVPPP
jgi:hypothetical protein